MRMTTSSLPPDVGMVATRSSIVPMGPRKRILPSWGLRFSAMSSLAMILRRWTRALRWGAGTSRYFWQSPSMRRRTMSGHGLPVRLDVDVGGPLVVGVDDDLVAELDDAAVRLVDLRRLLLGLALDLALLAGAEVVDDAAEVGLLDGGAGLAVARPDVGEDVVLEPHQELVAGGEVHRLDRVEPGEVVGVLDRHPHRALAPLERRADVLPQEVGGDALLHVLGDGGAAGLPEAAAVELGEGAEDLLLGDAHLLDQDLRDVQLVDRGRSSIAFSTSFSETRPLSTRAPNFEGLLVRAARCWL